jgi:hypothetical protein
MPSAALSASPSIPEIPLANPSGPGRSIRLAPTPSRLLKAIEAAALSHVPAASAAPPLAYSTPYGAMYRSRIEDFLESDLGQALRGEVQMIFTSPPFPLNRKKRYGNLVGDEYLEWLGSLAAPLGDLLTENGSIVVELGNAWEPGEPVMSTLALQALLKLLEAGEFRLCQQFVVHNPARLPSPAQWVNVERIRAKDAYTNLWWMSRTTRPKADNRKVLTGYSEAMQRLLKRQSYNAGGRPSEHHIGQTSFLSDNGGAIPSNVLQISNTVSTDDYRRYCKEQGIKLHPARMPPDLAEFFIRFLTDEGDLVFDPFGGSNTTGAAAEPLKRQWLATEPQEDYIAGSRGRFLGVAVAAPADGDIDADLVLRFLRAHGQPISRSGLANGLGIRATPGQWRRVLRELLDEGLVSAEGQTRGRRYAAA